MTEAAQLSNTINFDGLADASEDVIRNLSVEEVVFLAEDLNFRHSILDRDSATYEHVLSVRFGGLVDPAYIGAEKDTGKVTVSVDIGWNLSLNRVKTVSWDQEQLAALYSRIEQSGDNPEVYIKRVVSTSYKVAEAAYKSWPPEIQSAFEPARTVTPGTTSFTIEPKKEKSK